MRKNFCINTEMFTLHGKDLLDKNAHTNPFLTWPLTSALKIASFSIKFCDFMYSNIFLQQSTSNHDAWWNIAKIKYFFNNDHSHRQKQFETAIKTDQ